MREDHPIDRLVATVEGAVPATVANSMQVLSRQLASELDPVPRTSPHHLRRSSELAVRFVRVPIDGRTTDGRVAGVDMS